MNNKSKLLNFDEILSRVKSLLQTESDKEVASAIGMKPNTFNMRKKNNSVPLIEFVVLADSKKVNIDWLVYGTGPMYKDENPQYESEIPASEKDGLIVNEHSDLVKEFEDQAEALDVNKNLIILEKIDPEEFYATTGRIRGKVKNLLKHKSKKNSEEDPELR